MDGEGQPEKVLLHSMRNGNSIMLRTSSALWEILRESHARVVDRTLRMSGGIYNPTAASSIAEFTNAFRTWESEVGDYESLTGLKVDPPS